MASYGSNLILEFFQLSKEFILLNVISFIEFRMIVELTYLSSAASGVPPPQLEMQHHEAGGAGRCKARILHFFYT